jgi:ElaB/YqjD/DUF883 family membrane-anchored ribosome-binding protein
MNTNDNTTQLASGVIANAEDLLKTTASQTGEKVAAARTKIQDSLDAAKTKLAGIGRAGMDKAADAGKAADDFVHDYPWQAIGLGCAVAFVLGLLAARSSTFDDYSSQGMNLLSKLKNLRG